MRLTVGQEFQGYLRDRFVPKPRVRAEKTPMERAEVVDGWLARGFFTLLIVGIVGISLLVGAFGVWMLLVAVPWLFALFTIVDFANYYEEKAKRDLTQGEA